MTVNLFFAARPKPDIALAIRDLSDRLARAHGLNGRLIDPARLHLTLASAWAPQLALPEAIWRAQMLAAALRGAPLRARLDVCGSFRNRDRHPFVLRGEGLDELAAFRARLCFVMRRAGFVPPSSFTPHVTLLWADRCVEENPILPITWPIEEFELVLSADGAHIAMGRWPLTS